VPATEWCLHYQPCYLFTVSNSGLLFFHIGQPGDTAAYVVYPISGIKHWRKFGEVSCTERTVQGSDFESIPMVKTETRQLDIPLHDHLVVNLWQYIIIAELWQPEFSRHLTFLRFLETWPITVKFLKFCLESLHRDTDQRVVFIFREIWLTGKSVKLCVAYLTKKNFAWLSSCCYWVDRAKNLPEPAPDNVLRLRVLQISS